MATKAKRSSPLRRAEGRRPRGREDAALLALKRHIAAALQQRLGATKTTISDLARQLGTSRTAIRRVLDPLNTSFTANTLFRAMAALDLTIDVRVKPMSSDELMAVARKMVDAPTEREADKREAEFLRGFYGTTDAPGSARQHPSRAHAASAAAPA